MSAKSNKLALRRRRRMSRSNPTAPTSTAGKIATATGIVLATAAAGAGIAAANNPPADSKTGGHDPMAWAVGAFSGAAVAGVGGLGLALVSKNWRSVGLWTMGLGIIGGVGGYWFALTHAYSK